MTKIVCPSTECIHNGKDCVCQCKKVQLSWSNVATVNEGRQDFWTCKNYERSQEDKELEDRMNAYFAGLH